MTDQTESPTSASLAAAPAEAEAAPSSPTPKPRTRKRVFTFQKRWLQSLPIIERTLPEPVELDNRVLKAERTGAPVTNGISDKQRDVIVCMLCDEPSSKRELTKMWSRLNSRRGRIENHLVSKHPEFMRLLKHKREAEGDTAVQIFLENMRAGRCNVRNEINVGLYSQLQASVAEGHTELQKRALEYGVRDQMMELENLRKRSKVDKAESTSNYVGMAMLHATGIVPGRELLETNADSAGVLQMASSSAMQWQLVFFNKLVVITGGDSKAMVAMATQLRHFGANIVLTFANLQDMDEFTETQPSRDKSLESDSFNPGELMPTLCTFQTRDDIDAWSRSIASKFQRVDFLINYADFDTEKELDIAAAVEMQSDPKKKKNELIVTCGSLIEALCNSMQTACFQGAGADGSSMLTNGAIVNVAPAKDSSTIEAVTKELAVELEPRNVQVNSILLTSRQPDAENAAVEEGVDVPTLLRMILFLLAPSSRLLSGSVLRLRSTPQFDVARTDAAKSDREKVSI